MRTPIPAATTAEHATPTADTNHHASPEQTCTVCAWSCVCVTIRHAAGYGPRGRRTCRSCARAAGAELAECQACEVPVCEPRELLREAAYPPVQCSARCFCGGPCWGLKGVPGQPACTSQVGHVCSSEHAHQLHTAAR